MYIWIRSGFIYLQWFRWHLWLHLFPYALITAFEIASVSYTFFWNKRRVMRSKTWYTSPSVESDMWCDLRRSFNGFVFLIIFFLLTNLYNYKKMPLDSDVQYHHHCTFITIIRTFVGNYFPCIPFCCCCSSTSINLVLSCDLLWWRLFSFISFSFSKSEITWRLFFVWFHHIHSHQSVFWFVQTSLFRCC